MKKNIGRKRKSKKGIALITAVIFSMIMIIIVGVILKLAQGHYHSSAYQIKHTKAFYLANAGAEWAMYGLRTGTITPPASGWYEPDSSFKVSTPEGDVKVKVEISKVGLTIPSVCNIKASVDTSNVALK